MLGEKRQDTNYILYNPTYIKFESTKEKQKHDCYKKQFIVIKSSTNYTLYNPTYIKFKRTKEKQKHDCYKKQFSFLKKTNI